MNFKNLKVIGVMSGTSLDGIDLALVEFGFSGGKYEFKVEMAVTVEYEVEMLNRIRKCRELSGLELTILHKDWGVLIGNLIQKEFIQQGFNPDLISSHGHTVFHQPHNKFTLQIGSLEHIAAITKTKTVGDFRTFDVANGGQGAPLVPIGDKFLFSEYPFCLNLGGIANISFDKNGERLAYDVAVCNIIINQLAQLKGLEMDRGGALAKSGEFNEELYRNLNALPYFQAKKRPSLGIEQIEKEFFPLFKNSNISIETQLHTFYHHLAKQIAETIQHSKEKVLVTGGGAFNTFLMDCFIKEGINIEIPSKQIIAFKEAIVFAFLGYLKVNEQVNVLKSVTGANSDSSSGIVIKV